MRRVTKSGLFVVVAALLTMLLQYACAPAVDAENPCLAQESEESGLPRKNAALRLYGQKVESLVDSLYPLLQSWPRDKQSEPPPTGNYVIWVSGQTPGELPYQSKRGGLTVNLFHTRAAKCYKELRFVALVQSQAGETSSYQVWQPKLGVANLTVYAASAWVVDISSRSVVAYRKYPFIAPGKTGRLDRREMLDSAWFAIYAVGKWLEKGELYERLAIPYNR